MSSQGKKGTPDPTEIAGRYEVIQKLGAGAFGTVYKAKDKILGRVLAIKTIRLEGLAASGASLDEMLDRFKREAQVSAQLKHPNIVTIYDIGDSDGMSYLAMEFIDGVGLDKIIGQGKLGLDRTVSLGTQMADALDFAHQHSVVHRDIKPANIMVEAGDRVKVTDFGIAKVTDSGEHLTMTGSLLGTPSYMSPEQARGGVIDGRSDLFAAGCVLYEMMAGRKAFRGESITALIFKIITEEPQPIRELDPEIPDEMVRIITKALSKTPEGRYQSGREMVEDLNALGRAGASPTVRQVETPTLPGTMILPTPTVNTAAPTVARATPTLTKRLDAPPPPLPAAAPPPAPAARTAGPPARRPEPPPTAASPAKHKSGSGAGLFIGLGLAALLFVGAVAGAGWYFYLRKPSSVDVADTGPTPGPSATPLGMATPPPAASVAPPPPVSAAPTSAAPTPPPTPAVVATAPSAPPNPPSATARALRPTPAPAAGSTASEQGTSTQGSPKNMTFLDAEPEEPSDGRSAGEDLANKYRSGPGTSSGSTGRFRPREKSPRPMAPMERPAIATIRHIINIEEAYHKSHNRYGHLGDLSSAQIFFLDVPFKPNGFQRAGYTFQVTADSDSFHVTAVPLSGNGRPFVGDDSGFIRAGSD